MNSTRGARLSRTPKRRSPILMVILIVLCVVALAAGGYVGVLYAKSNMVRRTVGAVFSYGGLSHEKVFAGRQGLNVLILGTDENRDHKKRISTKITRSDTIMLARFDFAHNQINVLSIPRDTYVEIPGHGRRKINSAHALGGSALTIETLQHWLGVPIDHTVGINYRVFKQVVDAIGGVTVDVKRKLDYDDNWGDLHVHLKPGVQTLNGEQALGFVRIRHCDSDFGRIERQQQFMQALREQMAKPGTWMQVPKVLDAVADNLTGSMNYAQLLSLAMYAKGLPASAIRMETVPVSRTSISHVYPDQEALRALVQELFIDPPVRAANPRSAE